MKRFLYHVARQFFTTDSELTRDLFQGGGGEDVVVVNAESFPQLLAQICQLLQTLLDLLLSLGDVLGHGRLMSPDAGRTLCLIELHLRSDKGHLVFLCGFTLTRWFSLL